MEAEPKPVTARSQWLEVLGEPGAEEDGAGKGKSAFFKKLAGLRQMGSPDQDTWKSLRQVGPPHQPHHHDTLMCRGAGCWMCLGGVLRMVCGKQVLFVGVPLTALVAGVAFGFWRLAGPAARPKGLL